MVRLNDLITSGEHVASPAVHVPAALATACHASLAPRETSQGSFLYLYLQLVHECGRCLQDARQQQWLTLGAIPSVMERLVDRLLAGDPEWVRASTMGDARFSLAGHGANVAILSVRVGLELGMRRSGLVDLGIAALLHDIGMVKTDHLLEARHRLSPDQREEMRQHPIWGERIAQQCPDLPLMAREIIAQEHEREDGSGYPRRLAGDDIDERAQLVGLLDIYEALTHDRPYRRRVASAEAARIIAQRHRVAFRRPLLRAFLRAVPLFPVESWVRLSTGELAQVVATSSRHPFTPTVAVRFDHLRQPSPHLETIDLSRPSRFTIAEAIVDPPV